MEKITFNEVADTVIRCRWAIVIGNALTAACLGGIVAGAAAIAEHLASSNGVMPDVPVFDPSVVNQ